jgi:membrane protein
MRGHDLVLFAAGLTFYAAIAVVPLLLIAVYLAGLVLGEDTVGRLGSELADYAPENLGLADALRALADVGPRLGILSVLAALVPATTYGEGLARTFDGLADRAHRRGRGVRGRLKSLLLLAALPPVVAAGTLGVTVLPDLLGFGPAARVLGVYATFWLGWISSALLLAVVYVAFTPDPLGWRSVFWGAASTGSFLTGMSLGWVLFLQFDVAVGRAYGGSTAIATGVIAAVYLFLVQIVLLTGYVLTLHLAVRGGRPLGPVLPRPAPADAPAVADAPVTP